MSLMIAIVHRMQSVYMIEDGEYRLYTGAKQLNYRPFVKLTECPDIEWLPPNWTFV